MEVTSTKASLVANGDVEAASRLSVTLPRSQVEAALAEAEPPELILDVLRATGEEGEGERRKVSVEWDPADIKQLLEKTPGDGITFAFERDELDKLLSEDLELHGLRDKALVLTVAVAAATAGASSATAAYDASGSGSLQQGPTPVTSTRAHDEMTPGQRGIEAPAAAAHDEEGLTGRGIQPAVTADRDELGLAERGIQPAVTADRDELGLAERGIEPAVTAERDELGLTGRGIEPAVAPLRDEATLQQRGIPDDFVPKPDEAGLTQRGIETPAVSTPEVASASDGVSIDPSTAAALGVAGGMGLLILGAAFVARRQRAAHPA